jgi:hypothetical protein
MSSTMKFSLSSSLLEKQANEGLSVFISLNF